MEKTARKPSTDPTQERLRQNKANWNKEVSTFINDLIHLKKTMNGWPSKFFKERSRIGDPIPADPTTIIGSLAGDFQDIVNRGNAVVQEQLNYAKNRRKRQMKQLPLPLPPGAPKPPTAPTEPAAPTEPSKQLELALSSANSELFKLASALEDKYALNSEASNPLSRFITNILTPEFGFGEAARIRRLRMTMLKKCVQTLKSLKTLQKEIIKSSKNSVINSHKLMSYVSNHWNAVKNPFLAYKKPGALVEPSSQIINQELAGEPTPPKTPVMRYDAKDLATAEQYHKKVIDFKAFAAFIQSNSPAFKELNSLIESISAVPQEYQINALLKSNIPNLYTQALIEVNLELGTKGNSFEQIVKELQAKEKAQQTKNAQLKHLRKLRHQVLPGATSGTRLEIYDRIESIKRDLDHLMDLLQQGFDVEAIATSISGINTSINALRSLTRSLYFSEKPEEASTPFFF